MTHSAALRISTVALVCTALALTASLSGTGVFGQSRSTDAVKKGQGLYSQYCVSCHGSSAKGDGPAATSLKVPPADLTKISARYKGFPREKIMDIIDGEKYAIGHGSREMPVWGKKFREEQADQAKENLSALTRYLESLQPKD